MTSVAQITSVSSACGSVMDRMTVETTLMKTQLYVAQVNLNISHFGELVKINQIKNITTQ